MGTDCIQKAEIKKPDAILLDLMVTNMDGIKTFKHLQENPDSSQYISNLT